MTHYTNCLLLVISFQKPTDVEEQFMLQILLGRERSSILKKQQRT